MVRIQGKAKQPEVQQDSSSEEDVPQLRENKRKRTSKGGSSKEKEPSKAKVTPSMRLKKIKDIKIEQTRWADQPLLEELGILGEVRNIFRHNGLIGLFDMAYATYEEETRQFLATLSFYNDTSLDHTDENKGVLSFTIHGRTHEITMAQLARVFHFSMESPRTTMTLPPIGAQAVWRQITSGGIFNCGVSKAANIRNPAIRYAHTFLANTLFGRKEKGMVKEEELAILIEGIRPYLRTYANGEEIQGQAEPINYAYFLALRFLEYQHWITSHSDSSPLICIGGLITPILLACQAEIRREGPPNELRHIDAFYLSKARYLVGRIGVDQYGYKFNKKKGEPCVIILPNQQLTSFGRRENLLFNINAHHFYDPSRDGPLVTIKKKQPAPLRQDEEGVPEEVYGSRRYHFQPYAEPISSREVQIAHHHIGLLKRYIGWQGKQVKNLVKTVAKQGKLLKQQGKIIKELLKGSKKTHMEDDAALALAIQESERQYEGTSTSRARGRRSTSERAPLSSSSDDSGNLDYAIEDSDSSTPSQEF